MGRMVAIGLDQVIPDKCQVDTLLRREKKLMRNLRNVPVVTLVILVLNVIGLIYEYQNGEMQTMYRTMKRFRLMKDYNFRGIRKPTSQPEKN